MACTQPAPRSLNLIPCLHQGTQVTQLADWLGTGPEQILDQLHFLQCSFVLSFHSDHDTAFSGKLALLKLYIFCVSTPYIWGIQYAPCLHTIYQNCMFFCLACALFSYLLTAGNVKCGKTNKHFFNPFPTNAWKYKNYHQQQFVPFLLFAAAYFKSD